MVPNVQTSRIRRLVERQTVGFGPAPPSTESTSDEALVESAERAEPDSKRLASSL